MYKIRTIMYEEMSVFLNPSIKRKADMAKTLTNKCFIKYDLMRWLVGQMLRSEGLSLDICSWSISRSRGVYSLRLERRMRRPVGCLRLKRSGDIRVVCLCRTHMSWSSIKC